MKISISNIAWDNPEEEEISALMQSLSIRGVEIAPTKIWETPLEQDGVSIRGYRQFWEGKNIEIVAMQSLLFGRPELTIFDDEDVRLKTKEYLSKIIVLSSKLGIHVLVFGSPKNRSVRNLDKRKVWTIATEFFSDLGKIAEKCNVKFCIEPNPAEYGCDFINTSLQGLELVKEVNSPGFGLHLDSAAMILNGEDYYSTLEKCLPFLNHFHISEPYLQLVGERQDEHLKIAEALKSLGYRNWVSIEMKSGLSDSNFSSVRSAIEFVVKTYGN
ncbi:sugar phosphate isomerase/epimerase family protein [Effusibacillus dendaii]|uniref:Xylose isomerase-like TIM barrel domain-containing protein n=1 Tax=Effusibacillus dendaii TaxID=2743772 RepID=A0A7I8DES9_9BACL|nr:sugar phosphate isomerase/epimerase [Effusibacillus dendaii]BCJ87792.1 hypothetical protein skT53_27770 [Effusibacillus dendaii]